MVGVGNNECTIMNNVEETEERKRIKSNSISRHYNLKTLSVIYHMIVINLKKLRNMLKTCNVTV